MRGSRVAPDFDPAMVRGRVSLTSHYVAMGRPLMEGAHRTEERAMTLSPLSSPRSALLGGSPLARRRFVGGGSATSSSPLPGGHRSPGNGQCRLRRQCLVRHRRAEPRLGVHRLLRPRAAPRALRRAGIPARAPAPAWPGSARAHRTTRNRPAWRHGRAGLRPRPARTARTGASCRRPRRWPGPGYCRPWPWC